MPLQMRGTGALETVRYTPARDINYIYPHVVEHVEKLLYQGSNPAIQAMLTRAGVTEQDLADVVQAYCLFLNRAVEATGEDPVTALAACGWDDCLPEARLAFYFWIGATMSGIFFGGIREGVMLGEEKPPEIRDLLIMADRVQTYALAGRFRRWWLRLKHRYLPTKFKRRYTLRGV